ncbi:MAG: hypothetical protein JWR02_1982 [Mucilaginibacter sp.]|nr:hypothetical protein [Mucilaginibacter sp.]
MLKYITLFFSVSFFLSACKSDKTPDGIINQGRMASLLTEVHLVDGRLYLVKQESDSLYKYGTGRYVALFKKYHTDSVQFRKSMNYYATQPLALQKMYDQVALNLKKKTDSLNKLQFKQNALPK